MALMFLLVPGGNGSLSCGVADESEYLLQKFGKKSSSARVFTSDDPEKLLSDCLGALR